MYELSGRNIQLADGVTLAGGAPGAGFEFQNFDEHTDPLIKLGDSSTLLDLTVRTKEAPGRAVDYNGTIISAVGDDIQIINSSFGGLRKELVRVSGDNLSVVDTVFDGSYYQMRWVGEATNFTVENSLFQNSLGDGIKTERDRSGVGPQNATISDSVFLNNNRDGIDTAGGLKDSTVIDSYFINGFTGLDIKQMYEIDSDFSSGGPLNQNILITGSEFINNNNAIVVTTLDRVNFLTSGNATKWAAQDIHLENSIVEHFSGGRMFLVKDSLNVTWDNVTLLGAVTEKGEVSAYDVGLPKNISGTGVTKGAAREVLPDSYYQSLAGPDWSNITYPTDGTVTPADPVVDPDPISYTPPSEKDGGNKAPESDDPFNDVNLSTASSFTEFQDTGTATVLREGTTIKLEDSAWKSLDLSGRITKETVLTFDFKSNVEGEIQGIGFANEGDVKRDLKPMFFQLDGSEKWGIQDFNEAYETGSGFKSYTIPIGEYFTGSVDQIVLVNDDDADLGSMSVFSNIGLMKDDPFNNVNLGTASSFTEFQDTGTATVLREGTTIKLEDSAWKSLDLSGRITKETVLTFDFKSNVEGEIQGIGFANEGDVKSDLKPMFFQLDGSEKWGIQDFNEAYETGSGFKSYTIPIGEYFTGSVDQIVLVNDDDADLGSMSVFSNIGLIDGIA
jgi:hypothetical protein